MTKKDLYLFTDGACSGNPGPGGYGALCVINGVSIIELGGFAPSTTNNQMELEAVIVGLEELKNTSGSLSVYTDSKYVISGITSWIYGWIKNNWKTKEGAEVKNLDYWKRLFTLVTERKTKPEFIHILGHSGNPGNEKVNSIASQFAMQDEPELFRGSIDHYNLSLDEILITNLSKKNDPYYLCQNGNETLRFDSWKECEGYVKGRAGIKFKKVFSETEESQILKSWKKKG